MKTTGATKSLLYESLLSQRQLVQGQLEESWKRDAIQRGLERGS
jgi:hypothetical protein